MKNKILIIDDEPDVVELIEFNLKNSGYEVVTAPNGEEGLSKARTLLPALIVLDLMLPGLGGMEVCKLLKRETATCQIPIIMVTAKASEIDRVLGLELGADDYITKPFSTRELVLRVRGLLRRTQEGPPAPAERIQAPGMIIDFPRHEVLVSGQPVALTATEFKLVSLLAERRGRVQSREQLLREVWGYNMMVDTRTVDTHMRRVRLKLGDAAKNLETIRGFGYRFVG
jgi:DNA-binding response OmpR family regulator